MEVLVKAENLHKFFHRGRTFFSKSRYVQAVDDVNIEIHKREVLCLVGESGSGKTTLGKLLLRLIEPDEGNVWVDGENILKLGRNELRKMRRKMQYTPQNPYASLNPRKNVREILKRPLLTHNICKKNEIEKRILQMLSSVELYPPHMFTDKFPHELSGGQRQRVCIARAVSLNPLFVVADEPVSSLDVSVKAQIMTLLKKLQREHDCSLLFITHEMSIVRSMADTIAVMYLGRIIEIGSRDEIFRKQLHPYTRALIESTPVPDPKTARKEQKHGLYGEPPSSIHRPTGCALHPRCPYAFPKCSRISPSLQQVRRKHYIACHLLV